ncbi:TonB family protein / TonB-dependent receptor [Minicystis rosea]|nr:TonB family protein / TonB-dependent receptor [Minicystis rosea]
MPSPEGPTEPPYPAGATGDAEVILVLTIRADGTVKSAEVREGEEPFASAAREAAPSWHFTPARQQGKAISARIRFKVVFHAPAPEPKASPAPPASVPVPVSPPPSSSPPPPPKPLEVSVAGERSAPMTRTLTREEVRLMPGAFGDPFRAVEALPGVTPVATGVPYFYVRGAPPGNVGYYLDGVRVPLLFHVALGPSVIHPALVERVDLYPGGYPARFGRFSGGIVAGEVKDPEPRFHGEGNIRLFDAGAFVEAPFADGRGSALVAGRYSYTGALLSVFSPDVELGYWDYQGRVTYDITPEHRIGIFVFGAHDKLAQVRDGEKRTVLEGGFHRVDLRHDVRLPRGQIRHAVTFGFDESGTRNGEQTGKSWLFGARTEITWRTDELVTVRGGVDGQFERFAISITDEDGILSARELALLRLLTSRDDLALAAWADMVLRPVPGLEITPGVRGDLFTSGGVATPTVSPRVATRLEATPRIALTSAFGLATQPPSYLGAIPGQQVGGLRGGVQQGWMASAGVEFKLPGDVVTSLTGFKNAFFNLSDALGNRAPRSDTGNVRRAELRSTGNAYGIEIMARRSFSKRLGGFLSYTLSRSVRSLDRDVFDAGFDRRHVLNMALGYDFGKGYKAGLRFVFYSGIPMTIDYDVPRRQNGNGPPTVVEALQREVERRRLEAHVRTLGLPDRLPPFARLDLRGEKRWVFQKGRWIALTLEVQNASAGKEVLQYECSFEKGCVTDALGPIVIPSLGVEGGF